MNSGRDQDQYGAKDLSMLDLFRMETENQCAILIEGLLSLEKDPASQDVLKAMMRAAHSVKGAARILEMDQVVRLAHAMEDVFVAAQKGEITLSRDDIDVLLQGVDLFTEVASSHDEDIQILLARISEKVDQLTRSLSAIKNGQKEEKDADTGAEPSESKKGEQGRKGSASEPSSKSLPSKADVPKASPKKRAKIQGDVPRSVRISSLSMDRMLWLSGEMLVLSKWLPGLSSQMIHLKCRQADLLKKIDLFWQSLEEGRTTDVVESRFSELRKKAEAGYQLILECLTVLEEHAYKCVDLSHRLYSEALSSRMRPFSEGVKGIPRLVRDLARELGKEVHLEISGQETLVDRDILEQLDVPLSHLVSNAIDHGIEPPDERRALGKNPEATLRISAYHKAGRLVVEVSDDGRGIDINLLRKKVVDKGLVERQMATSLSQEELLEFLFLPNFTTRDQVSKVSGRGVGLDVVRNMVHEVRGSVKAYSIPGRGMRFELQLPLNFSVVRALLVQIAGEPFAFPLSSVQRAVLVSIDEIEDVEGRQYFATDDQRIALISAHQVLDLDGAPDQTQELSIVVVGEADRLFGVFVDKFLGIKELSVQPLDPRFGKVRDISAAAVLDDGSPVLILDVDEMIRSIEFLVSGNRLKRVEQVQASEAGRAIKRILVVDDSITVREVERRLLSAEGFEVDVAVDGMDGWHAVRNGDYDLVITDVDMPRLDGIELVEMIKGDSRLSHIPVMIVSYKDRDEDRQRGLDAGADYYLTKGSFHDQSLLQAVEDLIGRP